MIDQASRLRELVIAKDEEHTSPHNTAPVVVVSGCRRGVGASTVAIRIAESLAARDISCVLVDADLELPDISRRLDVIQRNKGTIDDVLAGRRTLAEVVCETTSGPKLLAGREPDSGSVNLGTVERNRMLGQLDRLRQNSELVLIDAGAGYSPWSECLWQAADILLSVTTIDDAAIVDTYAMLKAASSGGMLSKTKLLVNRCDRTSVADQVHQRIGRACFQFLNELVPAAPFLSEIVEHDRCATEDDEQNSANAINQLTDYVMECVQPYETAPFELSIT